MDSTPKISIVIASYNSAATIERALLSVERQELKDWECLVIDGASTDGTVAIAQSFAARDERFRVYSEPDQGVYDAFNKGWRKARGEFIHYLGSDDELLPEGLKILADNSDDVDYVYGGVWVRFRSGRKKLQVPRVLEEVAPKYSATCHQGVIMRRSLIEKLGGFDLEYKVIADCELTIHGFMEGMRTRRIPVPIAIFNIGGMSTDSLPGLKDKCKILRKYGFSEWTIRRYYVWHYIKRLLTLIKHRFD